MSCTVASGRDLLTFVLGVERMPFSSTRSLACLAIRFEVPVLSLLFVLTNSLVILLVFEQYTSLGCDLNFHSVVI